MNVVPVPVVVSLLTLHHDLGNVTVLDSQELFLIVISISTVSVEENDAHQNNILLTLSEELYQIIGYTQALLLFTFRILV